jgi:hypothetical protein
MNTYRRSVLIGILAVLLSIPFFAAGNARADDPYEENDDWATAWHPGENWARTWLSDINGLGIQADEDWYLIDVDMASQRIQVDCRFIHADGDIDIALYYDPFGAPLASSESPTDNELIDVAISGGGIYYIKVFYWDELIGGTGNTYDLRWDDFTEDVYEENDTRGTAWHPGYNWERKWLSDIDGSGIQADDDWYRIDVDAASHGIQVDCQFTHADGDINVGLYDSTGTLLASSETTTDNEFIDHPIPGGGTYYVRVYSGNAGNMYDLWWDDLSEDAYEENDDWGTAWHPGYNWERTWLSDIGGLGIQADDDWYRIDVDMTSERIQVDCQFIHADGDIDIGLYYYDPDNPPDPSWEPPDPSWEPLASSESVTDNELIDVAISGGGTYYIRVHFSNVGNAYDLRWDDFSSSSRNLISGLGETSGGRAEAFAGDYSHAGWLTVGWGAYNSVNGEVRIATGDIDGDGRDEIILGLAPVAGDPAIPGGWFQVLDDDYTHLAWGRVNWGAYNSANGETWPACGDVDGDDKDEIIIGLGSYPADGGYFEIFDFSSGRPIHKVWKRVNWGSYNSASGETRPACGDIDGDERDEIVMGLSGGGEGYLEVFDDGLAGYAHLAWGRVNWGAYNSANGETWPACGNVDADVKDEIVIGLGSYPAAGGWFEIFDFSSGRLTHKVWKRVNWVAYNSASGETRPACGDIDGDERDEIVMGLSGDGEGYLEVFDDALDGYVHLAWPRIHWGDYCNANGETRPTVKR